MPRYYTILVTIECLDSDSEFYHKYLNELWLIERDDPWQVERAIEFAMQLSQFAEYSRLVQEYKQGVSLLTSCYTNTEMIVASENLDETRSSLLSWLDNNPNQKQFLKLFRERLITDSTHTIVFEAFAKKLKTKYFIV